MFERDPAARSVLEILLCYPGFHAVLFHRLSHWLWNRRCYLLGRLASHIGRFLTGIEIHPGAVIGERFFIDHGMGVVIGETAVIGDDCTLYHGVTLGGTTWEQVKRHPTLEDNVIVSAGAKVLGNITIGRGSRIGAGSVVIKDVPAECTVVGIPGKVVSRSGVRVIPSEPQPSERPALDHHNLPDPDAKQYHDLAERVATLVKEVETLKRNVSGESAPIPKTNHIGGSS